ncbi:MAG: UDP-N-acetylmuramate--L-alanine ligase [Clostridia bacterium]|nr:UDP-N-acetylmuramate--L-alanine ligase [Clostridia bacterium]
MSTPNTHFGAAGISDLLRNCRSIFFIGIGGVNMSSLAEISALRGYRVGGSDRTPSATTERLAASGIEVFYSHDAAHVAYYDAVVYTVAISPDNPEYKAAISRGIPCFSRADYLGYVMTAYRHRIGVSGMHGKSTTTSMCALAFTDAGADPTVLCGAKMREFDSYYRIGGRDAFIFEACEYMDSFLDFNPSVAVILNIEMDHVDYFKSITQIRRSYSDFAALTGSSGCAVVNIDDDNVRIISAAYCGHLVTFSPSGSNTDADWRAGNINTSRGYPSFDIFRRGNDVPVSHVDLSVPGLHNVCNALAAFAAAMVCGLDPTAVAAGLSRFVGAKRRMEFKGQFCGANVFDDYGHHPTEVAATLRGFGDMGYRRIFCVFQPHTYSRTSELRDDFVTALRVADRVLLADIYAAREVDTLGMSSALLAQMVGDTASYFPTFEEISDALAAEVTEGDAVVVMGAGDIFKLFTVMGLE